MTPAHSRKDAVSVEDTDGVGARDVSKGAEVPFRVPVLEEERQRGEEVDDSRYNIVVRWCEGRGERGPADIVANCNFEGPGHGRGRDLATLKRVARGGDKSKGSCLAVGLVSVATLCLFAESASSDNVMGISEETSTGDLSVPSIKGPVRERTEAGTSTRDVEPPSDTDAASSSKGNPSTPSSSGPASVGNSGSSESNSSVSSGK